MKSEASLHFMCEARHVGIQINPQRNGRRGCVCGCRGKGLALAAFERAKRFPCRQSKTLPTLRINQTNLVTPGKATPMEGGSSIQS